MIAHAAADLVVVLHCAFILFAAAGGLLMLRWPRMAWAHLPSAVWGALVELMGWICPLTPLENRLRTAAGDASYGGGFIDRYIVPTVYPSGLTRGLQIALGVAVVASNLTIYAIVANRLRRRESRTT